MQYVHHLVLVFRAILAYHHNGCEVLGGREKDMPRVVYLSFCGKKPKKDTSTAVFLSFKG